MSTRLYRTFSEGKFTHPRPPLVVVGASAGGVQALQCLIPTLPRELPAAVAVVLHRVPVDDEGRLPRLLGTRACMAVDSAYHGEPIRPGRVYIAPTNAHLTVHDDTFSLSAGPRVNGSRPAIDVLFESAAEAHGPRVIGILLSGLLDDGTVGLAAIKSAGGYTIVQDPDEATYGDMPRNAIANVKIDVVCPIDDMTRLILTAISSITDS